MYVINRYVFESAYDHLHPKVISSGVTHFPTAPGQPKESRMAPSTAKIVIIGAGVLGTSAAFQLAAAGHQDIVLLDRGPIAGGTTPFAAGQTAYLPAHKHLLPFTTYCLTFFETLRR